MVEKTGLRALVISLSDLSKDPRVERQIRYLQKKGVCVTTLAFAPSNFSGVVHRNFEVGRCRRVYQLLRLMGTPFGLLDYFYWCDPLVKQALSSVKGEIFDLVIANEVESLPVALHCISEGGKVMFDAHEYAPRELEDQWRWRLFQQPMRRHLCDKYLSQANIITTVCPGIATEYTKNYAIPVSVVTNAPSEKDLRPIPVLPDRIKMIYQGGAIPARKIEQVFDIMDRLDDRFTLDMILVPGDLAYISKLKERIEKYPKIRLVDPVAMLEIPAFCNNYDIGFFPLQPTNFNYLNALPNKFFEFIQARIMPAVTPQKDMAALIHQYRCGVVAADFSSQAMADTLNNLTAEQIMQMKINCNQAAQKLNAEENEKILDRLLTPILSLS